MKRKTAPLLICLLLLVSCAPGMEQLSTTDKAAAVGIDLTQYFKILYGTALRITTDGTPAQQQFMKKVVNPQINTAQDTLTVYLIAVQDLKLQQSGDPKQIELLRAKLYDDLLTIQNALLQAASMTKE